MPLRDGVASARDLADWYRTIRRVGKKYRRQVGTRLHWLRPVRFTEKMQWRKLFDLDPLYGIASDKLAVRDYIRACVGPDLLVPVLWSGGDPGAVPFDLLEPPYIVKSTHGSSMSLRVYRREDVDPPAMRAAFQKWLDYCFGTAWDEPGYVPVPRQLIIEPLLLGDDGNAPLERSVFVFNGRVRVVQTRLPTDGPPRHGAYHDRDWQDLDWRLISPRAPGLFPRPQRYDDMVAVAEELGRAFDHVRVDFYDAGARLWIGELTLYSWSGLNPFTPDDADFILGSYWRIERPARRALATILRGRREIPEHEVAALRKRYREDRP